jgi:hypothetical protein
MLEVIERTLEESSRGRGVATASLVDSLPEFRRPQGWRGVVFPPGPGGRMASASMGGSTRREPMAIWVKGWTR